MLRDFKPRLYQQTIFATAAQHNTLVVLPTGLGKTAIAFMLASHRLEQYPSTKILFLAPTRPLVQQHYDTFLKEMDLQQESLAVLSGFVSPEKRGEIWSKAKIIFSTPQTIENDIINRRISLEDISLIIFDEAHRAVGDYSYNFISQQYNAKARHPRLLALTASPGSDKETIKEVCSNLFIEKIELRGESDPDVKPYVQDVDITWVPVHLPEELKQIKKHLDDCFSSKLSALSALGYASTDSSLSTKVGLIHLQASLHAKISSGEKDFEMLKAISSIAEALKIQHASELLESQGLEQMVLYMKGLQQQAVSTKIKAVKNLVSDHNFITALAKAESFAEKGIEHPKLAALIKIVSAQLNADKASKMIIFTQFRDTVMKIKTILDSQGVSNRVFVGQAKKKNTGLSQKEQKGVIKEFSLLSFNCLISTSVGEEGLDIPQVDLVIFYEPIPSAIRTVQRRGRTGRNRAGSVIVLMTKDTRDEAYRWSAHHKEKRMHRSINSLRGTLDTDPSLGVMAKKPGNLLTFVDPASISVYVDFREKSSGVLKELITLGVNVELKSLDIGDYMLSDSVVVEFKQVHDFVDSIIDGRLLSQLRGLTAYKKPLIIIEGSEDIYSQRNIHPNAIRGMLSTIAVSYRIPLLFTRNPKETANLMFIIARREQDTDKKDFQFHQSKPQSLKEQQEYLVSSIPGIGSTIAPFLLSHFKKPSAVFNAAISELEKVEQVGRKKAEKIRELLDTEYHEL